MNSHAMDSNKCIDQIECWDFFDTAYNEMKIISKKVDTSMMSTNCTDDFTCTSCGFIEYSNSEVCTNCGLMFTNKIHYDTFDSTNIIDEKDCDVKGYFKRCSSKYSKIAKMQTWYTWSNDEKKLYKLSQYTKDLCNKLNITLYIDYICNLVNTILYKIKDTDCSKRTRVKDGIIVVCIYYVYKKNNVFVKVDFSTKTLAKSFKLDIKYITKAEKSIIELINKNQITIDKNVFFNNNSPIMYIKNNLTQFNLSAEVTQMLYQKTEMVINICEKYELLLDHTPNSIGIGCFYYVLKTCNIDVDLYTFSKYYNLSSVTISKLFKKLVEKLNTIH